VKHFTIGRMGLALLATAVVCLGQTAVASAQGDSDNAKLCQKLGWKTLHRSDGSSFADEGACVAYAAQGGTLVESKSQIDCQAFGGTYSNDPATDETGGTPYDTFVWSCNGYTSSSNTLPTLFMDCRSDVPPDLEVDFILVRNRPSASCFIFKL
jgi:hypothetical protein